MLRCSVRVFDTPHFAAAAGEAFIDGVSEFNNWLSGRGRTMKPVYDHLVSAEARSSGLFSRQLSSSLTSSVGVGAMLAFPKR